MYAISLTAWEPIMMRSFVLLSAVFLGFVPVAAAQDAPKPLVEGLKAPAAVAVGLSGQLFVTVAGEDGKDGTGAVVRIDKDKAIPFATGLDDPRGAAFFQGQVLYVADRKRVCRIDPRGKVTVFAAAEAFPTAPQSLTGIAVDPESGLVYVSDAGDGKGKGGAVYRINQFKKVSLVLDGKKLSSMHTPTGLLMDGATHLLMADAGSGELHRIKLTDGSTAKIADGIDGCEGLAWDYHGRLFVSDGKNGRLLVIGKPGQKSQVMAKGFQNAAGICLGPTGKHVVVTDRKAGSVTSVPISVPGAEVDERPLALQTGLAFADLEWTGWKGETTTGKPNPLRPLVLTHAADGSNRVFVATQQGVLHVFPNDQKAKKTKVFLDIQDRVSWNPGQDEEGFLGLVFHPKFKSNGEFFVFYTMKKPKLTNVLSRFKVSKDDPDRADPDSEEELLRFTKPYWNHDGGTLCFGPDGFLYVTHGDGGAANDPHDNGQNLKSLLGKVLRLDVDRKDEGKKYASPKDNPFVNKPEARPEIWAYGLRNVWRMAFDRKTGKLWASDVGQNLYEEIDLLVSGGNYGWNVREGLHPFGANGSGPRKDLIDPIWEYHHNVGKSLTGGTVYRGKRWPSLDGSYIYGDYVTGHIWALRYDDAKQRVEANRRIDDRGLPILSFGEDERGEVYLLTHSATGKGVYRFALFK
jgi:glucose/arabinose dehydrogenase